MMESDSTGITERSPLLPRVPGRARLVKTFTAAERRLQLVRWYARGRPGPPPHGIKARVVRRYARQYGTRTLIETGTYRGDMLAAQRDGFDSFISIELSTELAAAASARFAHDPRVTIVEGDSAEVLPGLLAEISTACLFWLDGHWSGGETSRGDKETPIVSELDTVLRHPVIGHVVLIDDARFFPGANDAHYQHGEDFPSFEEVCAMVARERPGYDVTVELDIIRIAPAS